MASVILYGSSLISDSIASQIVCSDTDDVKDPSGTIFADHEEDGMKGFFTVLLPDTYTMY